MHTRSYISENDRNGGLFVNVVPADTASDYLSLEIANLTTNDRITVTILTADKVGFLELLKKVTDECLLRVRDEGQTGERDDG